MHLPQQVRYAGSLCLVLLASGLAAVSGAEPAASPAPSPPPPDPAVVKALAGKLFDAGSDAERDALLAAAPPAIARSYPLRRAFHKANGKTIFAGDYARAEVLIHYERQLAEQASDTLCLALAEWSDGNIAGQRGENAKALAHFQHCREVFEGLGDKQDLSSITLSLALVELQLNDFRHALGHARHAHDLFVELNDKEDTINSLNTLGNIDMDQGVADRAMDYYQQALTLAGDDEGWQVYLLHNIASVQVARGDFKAAAAAVERSAALSEKQGLKPALAENLNRLADYRVRDGALADAEKQYRRALELSEGLSDKRQSTLALDGLAEVGRQRGGAALRPAMALADRATAAARETDEPSRIARARTMAGKLHRALGEPAEARAAFEEAIALIEDARGQLSGGDEEAMAFFEDKVEPYQQMVALLVETRQPAQALALAERAKARVLVEVLRSPRLDPAEQMTGAERAAAERLAGEVTARNREIALAKAANPPADAARLGELQEGLRRARLARDTAESDFFVAHPELRNRQPPRADELTAQTIRASLGDARTALLEYVVADAQTFLFVVRAQPAPAAPDVQVFPLPLGRAALLARTQAFRQALANRSMGWEAGARALGSDLLEPGRAAWQDAARLIIVPDGPLWELPFQALAAESKPGEHVRTVWQNWPVSFAPSLTFLVQALAVHPAPPAHPARLLAFGNPATGKAAAAAQPAGAVLMDDELLPLPDAERQVRALAALYGEDRSKALLGAEAHEDAFKQLAGDYDVLHFATHGLFNNAAPMYSRLLLSQSDLAPDEDGLLEAWEWLPLKLHARLAVLSACETGRGKVGAGEGVLGTSWALFSAGCPASVVSQWKVDSASTTDLMIGFHKRLLAGERPAEALREAGLELAKDPRYEHPFYWAPFVLVGAAEAITAPAR